MKNTLKFTLIAILALALLPAIGHAQTATYNTTLSAAVNTTQQNITVAATTNFPSTGASPAWDMYCDGELMQINSVNTTTKVIGVTRGLSPTKSGNVPYTGTHPSGAICWFGVPGNSGPFMMAQSPIPGMACVATNYAFLPQIVAATADLVDCTGSRWNMWNPLTGVRNGYTAKTADYTALLTDFIIGYTTLTGGAKTVTLPVPNVGMRGKVYIIKNESTIATNSIWIYGNTTLNGSAGSVAIYGTGTAGITGGSLSVYTNGSAWFGY